MNLYQFTPDQLTVSSNQAIDNHLSAALKKGIIDSDTFDKLIRLRVVISDNENIFSKMIKKLAGKKDALHIHVVTLETELETE